MFAWQRKLPGVKYLDTMDDEALDEYMHLI